METNYFKELFAVDCTVHIERKNGLSYLSWAWAWAEVKKKYPTANYKIYETEKGCIYWTDGKTGWVKTSVTINEIEHIEYLPIMDFKNKSIPLDAITSFDANKAIQRGLTKACARHGLGLYIYAGEDLPESEKTKSKETDHTQRFYECKTLDELKTLWDEVGNQKYENIKNEMKQKIQNETSKN